MKKTVIFYYSGTGNTWYAANKIKQTLANNTGKCEIHSIENLSKLTIKSKLFTADIIGFGFPVYSADIPLPMKKFLEDFNYKVKKDVEVFLFATAKDKSRDVFAAAKEFLPDNLVDKIKWSRIFVMPNNFCIGRQKYTNDRKEVSRILARASRDIHDFCLAISRNTTSIAEVSKLKEIYSDIEKKSFRRKYSKLSSMLSIDSKKCTCCGDCALICPVNNIVYKGSKYVIKNNCALCMRCYNFCKHGAIMYDKKPRNTKYGIPYKGPTLMYIHNLIESKRIEIIKKEERDFLDRKE